MSTVEKEIADKIIKDAMTKTSKNNKSKCVRIVKYTNNWAKDSYGLIFEGMNLLEYHNSPYCSQVTIYWEHPEISFQDLAGKYLILRSENIFAVTGMAKLIAAKACDIRHLQIACSYAEVFGESVCDAFRDIKGIEMYCGENLQIFRLRGEANSKVIAAHPSKVFAGAFELTNESYAEWRDLNSKSYEAKRKTSSQSNPISIACKERIAEILRDCW